MKHLLLPLAIWLNVTSHVLADQATFLGTGSWFDEENWVFDGPYDGIPSAATDVYINSVGVVIDSSSAFFHDAFLNGNLLVSGLSTTLTQGNMLQVGQAATGTLSIQSGALVTTNSGFTYLGHGIGSQGTAVVEGAGSRWNHSLLYVGYNGNGALTIKEGSEVNSKFTTIGYGADSEGIVKITDANSTWDVNTLLIGRLGSATLNIESGASVTNIGSTQIGDETGSVGEATIDGIGSSLTTHGLTVGRLGSGTLKIKNGGSVVSGHNSTYVAASPTATGIIEISGTNSNLNTVGSQFIVAYSGNGQLNLSENGRVTSSYVILTNHGGSHGTINLLGTNSGRGVLETGYVFGGSQFGFLNFDGGILRATENQSNFLWNFFSGKIQFLAGGAIIDSGAYRIAIASSLQGTGGLTKLGSGVLTLAPISGSLGGGYTYTGPTRVSGGSLIVAAPIETSPVTVESTGLLGGTGSIGGTVTCHGRISPGASSNGTLTFNNGLTISSSGTLVFELGNNSDRINIVGNLTLDGTLEISSLSGFGAGDYTLATYTGMLTNGGLALDLMPSGYLGVIDTSTAGIVRLTVSQNFSPTDSWRFLYFATTNNLGNAADSSDPDNDGIVNLLERAFNLSPLLPNTTFLQSDVGTVGLPLISTVQGMAGPVLSIQFIRRKTSTNSSLTYTPQFSSNLNSESSWSAATESETVESIDAEWERVVIEDTAGTGQPKRFGRVRVTSNN